MSQWNLWYGFLLQLIFPKIYLTFGQLRCKNRYLFFHYAKVFYEIDLFFLSVIRHNLRKKFSRHILSKKYCYTISIIRFNLLLFKIWSTQQTFCLLQTYCINIIDIRPYAEVLLFSCKRISILGYSYFFFTNLHILVCKLKITRLRSSVSL